MARKRKRKSVEKIKSKLLPIIRSTAPHIILNVLSREYSSYVTRRQSDAEHEFWIKVSRSTANLGSGMEKWLEEWLDEEDEENQS